MLVGLVVFSIDGDSDDDVKVAAAGSRTITVSDGPRCSRDRDPVHTRMLLVAE
jgi:hypothetical protein